jgi:creatinine amidohydrolase
MLISKMSWDEIERINFEKSVLFLPIAPLEEHGTHLPIGVDCFLAEKTCELSAERLKRISNLKPYIFPLIPLGVAEPTLDFPGTISFSEIIFTDLVKNILINVSRWGFKYCVIAATHMDHLHLACIHAAIYLVEQVSSIQVVEPGANWVFGKHDEKPTPNNQEFMDLIPDVHAGRWETSLMMNLYPELVKTDLLSGLPPRDMREIRLPGTWRENGAIEGYMGTPSHASLEFGKNELWHLEMNADIAVELINGKKPELPKFIEEKVQKIIEKMKEY